jgi:pimeloyl-ACP methyl ester carboxylesterase
MFPVAGNDNHTLTGKQGVNTTVDSSHERRVEDRWVDIDGLRLHARDWTTSGEGGNVLLLHGLASTCRWWDLVAPRLVDAGLGPVALDQRGHGESDRLPTGYGFEDVAKDAIAVAENLRMASPFVVVGHSWGGSSAVAMVAWYPEAIAGAVSVDGVFDRAADRWTWEETWERLRPPPVRATREELVSMMRNGPFKDFWSEEIEEIFLSLFREADDDRLVPRFPVDAHEQVIRAIYEADPQEWFEALRRPVLLLPTRDSGNPEWLEAKERAVKRFQGPLVSVKWLEDAIHDVPIQRPDVVAAHIVEACRAWFDTA